MSLDSQRPPSVDRLARSLSDTGLAHPLLVEVARRAIAEGDVDGARRRAIELRRTLLTPVINATGVLLHTNLGRAPMAFHQSERAQTVEFDLATGERGSRQRSVGQLFAALCGAESAVIVNNNAAAVMLVLAALAAGRDVAVSRGESVEIGGAFRVPDVLEQSGCRLVDVGTTNRTRASDYARAIAQPGNDIAAVLKVHPSNYRVEGFVESASVEAIAEITAPRDSSTSNSIPLVVDLGSGLLDRATPWLHGSADSPAPPTWLTDEPAAKQTLAAGADIVTFSGDKLLGGPQAGIIAGRADLVAACAKHPLMRALRCGGLVLGALQQVALSYLDRTAGAEVAFWRMATTPTTSLRGRAERIAAAVNAQPPNNGVGADNAGRPLAAVVDTEALPGAGSAPGVTIDSVGVQLAGDWLDPLRAHDPPIIARSRDDMTIIDLRAVDAADDDIIIGAITTIIQYGAEADDSQRTRPDRSG